MDVEIENPRRHGQVGETRLLSAFAQRGVQRALRDLEMTAHLQPSAEPAVMMEEEPAPAIDDEETRRDMSRRKRPSGEWSRRSLHQRNQLALMTPFRIICGLVASKLLAKVHQCDGYHW